MPAIPASLVRELRELRDRTIPFYDLQPRLLGKRYRRGGWTARQVLVHISDIEAVFLERLRRVVAQDKALIMAIEPDAWADRLDYAKRDLGIAQSLFAASRSAAIELIEAHRGEYDRFGVHSEQGKLTLADIAARVAWHNRHHLEQVERAIS
jgi:hypothetical protein